MNIESLALPDLKLIRPKLHHDSRGYLTEIMNDGRMREHGLPESFVQENQSLSLKKRTVRGLHCQKPPYAQGKLVRVLRGRILDIAVDVRHGSATFGKHANVVLSEDEVAQLYIPPGFLHGFSTLTDDCVVLYKMTTPYAPGSEAGVIWNDPALGIDWQIDPARAILSDKDLILPTLKDFPQLNW